MSNPTSTPPALPAGGVDPKTPQPVARPSGGSDWTKELGALAGAAITLLLGILLGLSNQAATDVDLGLRVPALIAALLLVGQGVVNLRRHASTPLVDADGKVIDQSGRSVAVAKRPRNPVQAAATPTAIIVPVVVMALAVWLGVADLTVQAPPDLALLSLISAFALFATGWSLLPARR